MIGQSKIIPASKLQRICLESDQKVFFQTAMKYDFEMISPNEPFLSHGFEVYGQS